ncbi:riboflavin synthase [Paenibacillus physcomitrellae]|uniref:Riboflavin synthase n=1 Tax=Paenibacillus physcomitrellae TaxID=1619311 RepID=A0ABQ1FNW9_9BACL|nr:riboflavin synthase [Paenibacillus physcomitrellae]GGA22742.1 riboflavin synthase subunit alpha [Paenibacillus physcomitrellae]
MFTGLVEEVGRLKSVSRSGEAMVLGIEAHTIMEDMGLGDSIAVNGVCLTVTSMTASSFNVDVMPQTYKHTNLSKLTAGQKLNLERAMSAGGRFGGHIVQGHVDGTGIIVDVQRDYNAVVYTIRPVHSDLLRYMVAQGSITVDGTSLTIAALNEDRFSVSIIPHTLAQTALGTRKPGDSVNLECDILGKYVERLLFYKSPADQSAVAGSKGLDLNFLADNGFV